MKDKQITINIDRRFITDNVEPTVRIWFRLTDCLCFSLSCHLAYTYLEGSNGVTEEGSILPHRVSVGSGLS